MNFQTEYKNINFRITLEKVLTADTSLLVGDKFNRLPNQTLIAIKKGLIIPFNLFIISEKEAESRTHYWSNILLCN